MTQEEKWQQQYNQIMEFMEKNHRRPSKHRLEDHKMLNWMKNAKKRMAKGLLTPHREEQLKVMLAVADKYRRVNQYTTAAEPSLMEIAAAEEV